MDIVTLAKAKDYTEERYTDFIGLFGSAIGTPVRDGLVVEYLLNEGKGQVAYDYSGNGNHAMIGTTKQADTNDPLWTPQGLSFDGVDDVAAIENIPIVSNAATMDVWVKPLAWPTKTTAGLMWFTRITNFIYTELGVNTFWVTELPKKKGGVRRNLDIVISKFPLDTITNLTVTVINTGESVTLKAYINGVFSNQNVVNEADGEDNIIMNNPKFTIFKGTSGFQADIFLQRAYSRVLTADEITENYTWSKNYLTKKGVVF